MKLDTTILYTDLSDSTSLAIRDQRVAANVFKIFLACSARLIRSCNGHIRSFDGDRVMGIFIGDSKNSNAAKCALHINHVFQKLIKERLKPKYEILRDGSYELAHCTGIDTSQVFAVRSGIRGNNDLIWVGRAPNVAAKLSGIRDLPYSSYITKNVYDRLNQNSKVTSDTNANMWQVVNNWNQVSGIATLYKSNYLWEP